MAGLLLDWDALDDSSVGAWPFANMKEGGLLGVPDVITATAGKGKGFRVVGTDVRVEMSELCVFLATGWASRC